MLGLKSDFQTRIEKKLWVLCVLIAWFVDMRLQERHYPKIFRQCIVTISEVCKGQWKVVSWYSWWPHYCSINSCLKEFQWQLCKIIFRINQMNWKMTVSFFLETTLPKIYCRMSKLLIVFSKFALSVLVPFALTYLFESGFYTLVLMKTKMRNQLCVKSYMRLARKPNKMLLNWPVNFRNTHHIDKLKCKIIF